MASLLQHSPLHQAYLSRALSFLLVSALIAASAAASSASLFALPSSLDIRSLPPSRPESAAGPSHEPQVPPHGAPFEAHVLSSDSGLGSNENATAVDSPATRDLTVSPFHVFRAPFGCALIEIPEKRAPEIPDVELSDTSDPTDDDVSGVTRLDVASRADALYLEETAVRSKKGRDSSLDQSQEEKERDDGEAEWEAERAEGEAEWEAEGGEGEVRTVFGELAAPLTVATPLRVFRAADGSLMEEPEISDDPVLFTSLDELYLEEVVVRTRAARERTRAPLARTRASLAGESRQLERGVSGEGGADGAIFGAFHVFRADNGSLVELTEREAALTATDGDRLPLMEFNGASLADLDQLHNQENPVRFRPSPPSSPTPVRRRLRMTADKQIEIVYENEEEEDAKPKAARDAGDEEKEEEKEEENEEEKEEENEEEEERRAMQPVHVFRGADGVLHETEEDNSGDKRNASEGDDDSSERGLDGGVGCGERRRKGLRMNSRENAPGDAPLDAPADAPVDAAVDAAAEAELEYEFALAVRTRRVMTFGGV
ncbi:hypothetical protein CLOM_g10721 [Closterium sp. NIES-68]|nr:hypothetical protein CLOM_g10721 [Closterium sp. NIES-68]GJP65783.1 hypothetical protein CLOP_g22640 [Closterium sp. NIES-67]